MSLHGPAGRAHCGELSWRKDRADARFRTVLMEMSVVGLLRVAAAMRRMTFRSRAWTADPAQSVVETSPQSRRHPRNRLKRRTKR